MRHIYLDIYTKKPSHLKELTYHTHFYTENSTISTPFMTVGLDVLRTCSMCQFLGLGVLYFTFWPKMCSLNRVTFSKES